MRNPVSQLLEKRALHQAVGSALQSGVGCYKMTWQATPEHDDRALADSLLTWCRTTLERTHHPSGVDSVSLALLAHGRDERPFASAQFSILRPADFSAGGRAEADVRDILQTWYGEGILHKRGVRLSALLFSWGDLAEQLVSEG